MITNISRRVTTGALAIAGSVAAFGFANTAPAQAQAVCPLPLGQLFSGFKSAPCRVGDKLFTFLGSSPTSGPIDNGVLLIDQILSPTIDRHTFNYRPTPALTQAGGAFVIDYTVEILDPAKMFKDFSIGYDATGAGNSGIFTEKMVWSDSINGSALIGTSTATTALGASGAMVPVPSGITKLFVRDTYRVDSPTGSLNSVTNDFTQMPKVKVPEPSAILGILAVAGVGAFARRKS
ncbi:PEP-CTERM sorting domain-containing protein [Microcystis sp. LEGE 08355]|uniref:PEP-CTERM sorting domain-containing protein n=1 Tax=Microcystis sp. LEGE 08355 TaxID=1828687 RepID=UPI00188222D1|nr:PEP-CTERM sorting domain-containing protein [Microcystis sp. LEGE 08355]